MHIEKNVCESILGTLLNMKGKSKDGFKSRMDLEKMGIRCDLHPKESGTKHYLPPALYTLSKEEKGKFLKRLQQLKWPDGYSSNIGQRVSLGECKISGLKSHDCHILMQQLLPVALRGLAHKGPRNAIVRLCAYFNGICQRVIDRKQLEKLENEIVETLCMFERFFPPSFFDIMVHVTIHLAREAHLCGPVHFRWMYPFERIMKVYKGYVRNRARPEGCMAECYLVDECVEFCSEQMKKVSEIGFRRSRNEDIECESTERGRPISKGISKPIPPDMLAIAHRYVLFNSDEVKPYIEEHREELRRSDSRLARNEHLLEKRHMETFSSWIKTTISVSTNVLGKLKWLARGLRTEVMSYSGYVVNGQRFHTKDIERSTQDSGVSIETETICRSSVRDTNQVIEKITYYGILKDIILLNYYTFEVPLFDCDWANIRNGIKVDDGFTLVNLREGQSQFAKDPYILASQAKQVFYSRESETSSWYVVLKAPIRGSHDVDSFEENPYMPYAPLDVSRLDIVDDDDHPYVRDDCEVIIV
ncbi:uncharacterized protein LOC132273557 [Cornus florida]|uniref:uncharacterized protein LOC132273557 n=1 Tax=Cornus florida TaxID=4283 RepID=UPI00289ADAA3|nr:uncharacterized protein LOC132273557 [Cornus florida]